MAIVTVSVAPDVLTAPDPTKLMLFPELVAVPESVVAVVVIVPERLTCPLVTLKSELSNEQIPLFADPTPAAASSPS